MKLSIFPKSTPLPKSKKEKTENAKYFSRPHLPEVVEIDTDETLISVITSFAWSPFIFKQARLQDDFVSTDFLVLDIDSGLTIEAAEARIHEANVACLCLPSTSHKPNAHRFRLILPLSRTITKVEDFLASMKDLAESFPEADPSCLTDYARAYFSSTTDDGFFYEGDLLEPVIAPELIKSSYDGLSTVSSIPVDATLEELVKELYGEPRDYIPEAVAFFLKEAYTGLSGIWNSSLNKACYIMGLQNVPEEVVEDLIAHLAPNPLDKSDLTTIKRSWRDGQRDREE